MSNNISFSTKEVNDQFIAVIGNGTTFANISLLPMIDFDLLRKEILDTMERAKTKKIKVSYSSNKFKNKKSLLEFLNLIESDYYISYQKYLNCYNDIKLLWQNKLMNDISIEDQELMVLSNMQNQLHSFTTKFSLVGAFYRLYEDITKKQSYHFLLEIR